MNQNHISNIDNNNNNLSSNNNYIDIVDVNLNENVLLDTTR